VSEPTLSPPPVEESAQISEPFKKLQAVGRWIESTPSEDDMVDAVVAAMSVASHDAGETLTAAQLVVVQKWLHNFFELQHTFGMLVGGMLTVADADSAEKAPTFELSTHGERVLAQIEAEVGNADSSAEPE